MWIQELLLMQAPPIPKAVALPFAVVLCLSLLVVLLKWKGFNEGVNISPVASNPHLFIRDLKDIENRCSIDIAPIHLNLPKKIIKKIAITINSSGKTKNRLCNLISMLEVQSKQLGLALDITIFSDEPIEQSLLCGKAKVFIWEKDSPHERFVLQIHSIFINYH